MTRPVVRFILVCEGNSDKALVEHLQSLLIHCGAFEAVGTAVSWSSIKTSRERATSALGAKIRTLLAIDSEYDLLFIHRDSDNIGYESRLAEIESATAGIEEIPHWAPTIPVRETEAWLLLDEAAIRRVAGNPGGIVSLGLPEPLQVEDVPRPKETLQAALAAASGRRGSRLRKFRKNFPHHRRILLQQLPVGGQLEQVPAWRRLQQAVLDFLDAWAE